MSKIGFADLLKILADTDSQTSKLVVIGINQAGVDITNFAPDLVNRIDRIRFESEPDSKIRELITKGEEALNVSIHAAQNIVEGAQGSFYLAQLLSNEICLQQGILERSTEYDRGRDDLRVGTSPGCRAPEGRFRSLGAIEDRSANPVVAGELRGGVTGRGRPAARGGPQPFPAVGAVRRARRG